MYHLVIFISESCLDHAGSSEHEGLGTVPPLQDDRLPEALSRGVQSRGSERTAAGANGGSSALLRADQVEECDERC